MRWLQEDFGATADAESWAQQFRGSLNLWGITEGTHVLTLMLFAGTIWLVDLRMLGIAFRNTPFSRLNDRILPYTAFAFAVMIVTGIILFLAKPMDYYHNVWFRVKMIFLLIAAANIAWFHYTVQKTQPEWDADPTPPAKVRLSGAVSLTSWVVIIVVGRFIAYDWYNCGKVQPDFVNWFAECASYPTGIVTEDASAFDEGAVDGETGEAQTNEEQLMEQEGVDPSGLPDAAQPDAAQPGNGEPNEGGE
jgi:hypothetical protein